jgi:large subunit ribosomal protein L21
MKKAVITTGGHQYFVTEGETFAVELLDTDKETVTFEALLVTDESSTKVGTPVVAGVTVTAEVVEADVKDDKVTAIRYKAKKRVKKVRGHRQRHAQLKITKIG